MKFKKRSNDVFTLVLIRHGESAWNQEVRFTGWADVDLSARGRQQARAADRLLFNAGYTFDLAFTSVLKRSIRTQWLIFDEMDLMWVPIQSDWRLNERHYGALTGLNKREVARSYGDAQLLQWRRAYEAVPPSLLEQDMRAPFQIHRYGMPANEQIPIAESLQQTVERVLPCWVDAIAPAIRAGKRVIVNAHGNSLRALMKYLDAISDSDIARLDIPNGVPIVYQLDTQLVPISHCFLAEPSCQIPTETVL